MKPFKILIFLLFNLTVHAQQIGDGYAPVNNNLNSELKSSFFTAQDPIGGIPTGGWQHILVIRHGNPYNNYQFQLGTSLLNDNRLFFRKIQNGNYVNWLELATRGENTFIGHQIITNSNSSAYMILKKPSSQQECGIQFQNENSTLFFLYNDNITNSLNIQSKNETDDKPRVMMPIDNNNVYLGLSGGFIGIGTNNPKNLLDVNGTIHAKEVKIDLNNWSDFVFEPDYDLPSLQDVEQHIKEKGHLPEMPTTKEVIENGVNIGEMQSKLLQKVEELTLYMIELKKENDILKKEIKELKNNQ